MHRWRWAHAAPVIGVLVLLVLSSGVWTAPVAPGPGTGGATAHSPSSATERATSTAAFAATARPTASGGSWRSDRAYSPVTRAAEQAIAAHRFAARNALLPTPYVAARNPASGPVTLLEQGGPVSMGLADLGIGSTGGYEYNTSAFAGTLHLTSFSAYSPGYPSFQEAPDWVTIQLNTVGVNLTYPGETSGTFWFQNVVHLNSTTLEFEDNIWNFSAPTAGLVVSPFYQHAAGGHIEAGLFYYDYDATSYAVGYPLTITLTNQLAIVGGRPAVFFNFSLTEPSGTHNVSYDEVIFSGPTSVSAPPQFRVDGLQYDPEMSEYDAELIFGGDGGGANANIQQAAGILTLDYWNAAAERYQSVPSAYDHGVDSAETSTGISAYYLGSTEYVGQGPSLLYGLWNTTDSAAGPEASPGFIQVNLTVTPAYAFVFATNTTAWSTTLVRANLTPAPTNLAGMVRAQLPPPTIANPYIFAAWANGYLYNWVSVVDNGTGTAALTLIASPTTLDAPIYLTGDGVAQAIGTAGLSGIQYSGSGSNAVFWINQTSDSLAPPFLRLNAYGYPTFVLFAAERVNLTVHLNGFVQSPSTFEYTSWNVSAGLTTRPLPFWTQAYCFFYGTGRFSVTNTTVVGNTTLDYLQVYSPGVVEFYRTNDSQATGIVTGQESLGVDADLATNVTLSQIAGETGADAVTLVNSTTVTGKDITGNGTDYRGFVTWALDISGGSGIILTSVTATNQSVGLVINGTSAVRVTHLNATGSKAPATAGQINGTTALSVQDMFLGEGSTGLIVNATTTLTLANISVTQNGYAGNLSESSGITIRNLSVLQSQAGGFDLWSDRDVSLNHAVAVGSTSSVLSSLIDSSQAVLQNLTVSNLATAVTASNDTGLTIRSLLAANGSVGATLTDLAWVNATGVSASNGSIGIAWNIGAHGLIRTGSVGLNCTGVDISNVTNVSVVGLSASEPTLPAPYFINPLSFLQYPVAPVALFNDSNATVASISADEFPFAIVENYTNASVITNVTAWNGIYGIQVNESVVLTISRAFLDNNVYGLYLDNVSRANVTGSTVEDSGVYGTVITNATTIHLYGNNFVANNNSSTSGSFSAAHLQVYVNNSTDIHFNSSFGMGNYWSDHSGSGVYVIRTSPTVQDAEPQTQFISNYLRFLAVGLPSLSLWGFRFSPADINYSTYAPLIDIPGWSLATASYGFLVHPNATYVPTPSSGTVSFAGLDENVTIVFSHVLEFVVSGLPRGTSQWQIVFNGTTESATVSSAGAAWLNLTVENGKYPYSTVKIPGYWQTSLTASGSILVSGANMTESLAYVPFTYAVTFKEQGLPLNASWSVVVDNSTYRSTNSTIVVPLTNGSHTYTVPFVTGYTVSAGPGSVYVSGAKETIPITFSAPAPPGIPIWVYAGIGGAGVAAALAVVLLLRRRRRSQPRAPADQPFS